MSFQGDVAGIGLGELLQGLARGGRDGVLTLDGEDLHAVLGLKNTLLYLLPGPDEDTELWRERCQRAWVFDPDPNQEAARRQSIAQANRLETLFCMLEAPNLHFRFEPGALPAARPSQSLKKTEALELTPAGEAERESPWGQGFSVEYVLLEHARIADEVQGKVPIHSYDLPRALDARNAPEASRTFLFQCDGSTTVEELGDRMGWTLRHTRAAVQDHLQAGLLRIPPVRELLVASQREIEGGDIGRAATRLSGWVEAAEPGPLDPGDRELLENEWASGRLVLALSGMRPASARAVLRRMDLGSNAEIETILERWQALSERFKSDAVTRLRTLALRTSVAADPEQPVALDLLKQARAAQDAGLHLRARVFLRLATTQEPERLSTRMELGVRLVELGLIEEGAPWIVDTAQELVADGQGEKAIGPLRTLLKVDAGQREAHGLLLQIRMRSSSRKRRRRNSLVALAVLLLFSVAALVQVRAQHNTDVQIAEITEHLHDPDRALALLSQYFGDDESERIRSLRTALMNAKAEKEDRAREDWGDEFESIRHECAEGDPLTGLDRALGFGSLPSHLVRPDSPSRADLLNVLASRFETRSDELDLPVDATLAELHEEQRLANTLAEVLARVGDADGDEVQTFLFHVEGLHENILDRREKRASERRERLEHEHELEQEQVLAAARAHAEAGDLERAVLAYDELFGMDDSEALWPILEEEVTLVRGHHEAVLRAQSLAEAGDHDEAWSALQSACPQPSEHLLPWNVSSEPQGTRVTFADGRTRVTPFTIHSAFGEPVELTFELSGCDTRRVFAERPGDLHVRMHRSPERSWQSDHLVESAPVPVGDDHVVADRSGRLARVGQRGRERWTRELRTLGGIARTPVFLPRRPGFLLVLSEDGDAWLVRAEDGKAEGPIHLGSPPVDGPSVTRSGVSARFANNTLALWSEDLEPESFDSLHLFVQANGEKALPAPEAEEPRPDDLPKSAVVLRRGADSADFLQSPWSDWVIEVQDDHYLVRSTDRSPREFTVSRKGNWMFLSWEAPNALIEEGRLWVSDEDGLRSFLPDQGPTIASRR